MILISPFTGDIPTTLWIKYLILMIIHHTITCFLWFISDGSYITVINEEGSQPGWNYIRDGTPYTRSMVIVAKVALYEVSDYDPPYYCCIIPLEVSHGFSNGRTTISFNRYYICHAQVEFNLVDSWQHSNYYCQKDSVSLVFHGGI